MCPGLNFKIGLKCKFCLNMYDFMLRFKAKLKSKQKRKYQSRETEAEQCEMVAKTSASDKSDNSDKKR